jgi:very-short-patch-repair endonuclease
VARTASSPDDPVILHVDFTRVDGDRTGGTGLDPRLEYQALCDALVQDEARNRRICEDVVNATREGRFPLVLTERTGHLRLLAERLAVDVPHLICLQGGMGRKELRAALTRVAEKPDAAGRVILATGKFIGEGFDDPRLDTLFLAMPVSWRGTIAQYAGRLHRLHEGKREVRIYDYADLNVSMLSRMFDKRCRGYESLGYTLLIPGSALPGWPAEVPLPVDPGWKRDYAASVRRLIRDGVDVPLAGLFVSATGSGGAQGAGENQARSASEAFFFRRLQTLRETAGLFHLNAELPISFDGRGRMEADFLCPGAKVVVELDGAQHLADADAYRRDRRKDALLQQNGYFVLRFLAGDLGRNLDQILDTVLATLAHRRSQGHG